MTNEEAKMQIQAIPEKIWDQLSEPDREAMEMAFSALQALDEIYAFIMQSEASETTDGVLEIFDALEAQEAKAQLSAEGATPKVKKTCITCKHNSTSNKKWPCVDCDMREPADRWEPQELSKNSPKLDKENGDLQPTRNQLATDCISRQAAIDGVKTLHEVAWKNWHEPTLSPNVVIDMIRELPSAQPEPSKKQKQQESLLRDHCCEYKEQTDKLEDGDELDEAIKIAEENGKERIHDWMPNEWGGKRRKLASWLCELKRLRTEVYFLKAEKENEPVDLLGDVPCKTCKWRVTTTEKCEECIDGVSDNYEVQEPCEDAVSRKAAIDAALSAFSRGLLASPDIRKLPSVQPKRKKGEWTKDCACEICGFEPWYERDIHTLSFCPNCGADMRGEAERRTDQWTRYID